ncbi:MAG: TIR domain-containing protein [Clostridia bacterium]|nr:TIR domain-containing protein [Clostridia bacterium]
MKNDHPVTCCSRCGGTLEFINGLSAVCPFCGCRYTFKDEKKQALALSLARANAYLTNCDYDGAINEYGAIIADYPENAEANWGLALSRYGIEYVKDSRTDKLIPTCRRTVKQSILQDENYLAAVKYSDPKQAELYTQQAKIIDRLQREIKRKMSEEDDFDVFICYRSADENGNPTRERTVARRIYNELTSRGIKTFFSEVTLNGRLGDDYEPIIYKALYSCKFFILVALSEENINTPWVKNEWSRYRDRQEEEGISGACCAVFEGSALNLPPFMRSVQGVNLAKYPAGGYEIEIADNLCTRLGKSKINKGYSLGNDVYGDVKKYLTDGETELACGRFIKAAASFSKAVELDGRCGDAWLGALMADLEVRSYGGGKKLVQEITDRLYDTASDYNECRERLAFNGRIIYILNSANYKNAVKYSKNTVATALEVAKTEITQSVKKCNGELNRCMQSFPAEDSGSTYGGAKDFYNGIVNRIRRIGKQ